MTATATAETTAIDRSELTLARPVLHRSPVFELLHLGRTLSRQLDQHGAMVFPDKPSQFSAQQLTGMYGQIYEKLGMEQADAFAASARRLRVYHPALVAKLLVELEAHGWRAESFELPVLPAEVRYKSILDARARAGEVRTEFLKAAIGEVTPAGSIASEIAGLNVQVRAEKLSQLAFFEISVAFLGEPVARLPLPAIAREADREAAVIRKKANELLGSGPLKDKTADQLADLPLEPRGVVVNEAPGSIVSWTRLLVDHSFVVARYGYRSAGVLMHMGANKFCNMANLNLIADALRCAIIDAYVRDLAQRQARVAAAAQQPALPETGPVNNS